MKRTTCDPHLEPYLPQVLPVTWVDCDNFPRGFTTHLFSREDGLRVLMGVEFHDRDGHQQERWLHVSCSYKDRLPTYDDLCEVKALFIGRALAAYQVFPADSQKVNVHKFTLHLYSCIDREALPDFRIGGLI